MPTKDNFLLFTYCRYYITSLQRLLVKKQFKSMFFLTFLLLTEVEGSGPPRSGSVQIFMYPDPHPRGPKNIQSYGSGSGTLVISRIL
jgi:hypothetical protein